jgi:hypothetical protein
MQLIYKGYYNSCGIGEKQKMSPKGNVIGSFSSSFLHLRDAKIVWACKNGSKIIGYEGRNELEWSMLTMNGAC